MENCGIRGQFADKTKRNWYELVPSRKSGGVKHHFMIPISRVGNGNFARGLYSTIQKSSSEENLERAFLDRGRARLSPGSEDGDKEGYL